MEKKKKEENKKKKKEDFQVDTTRFVGVRLSSFRTTHPIFRPNESERPPDPIRIPHPLNIEPHVKREGTETTTKSKVDTRKRKKKRKPPRRRMVVGDIKPTQSERIFNNRVQRPSSLRVKNIVIDDDTQDDEFENVKYPPSVVKYGEKNEGSIKSPVVGGGYLEDDEIYFMQLPYELPLNTERKMKKHRKKIGQVEVKKDFWSKDFENMLKSAGGGKIGEMIVYKSGKVKMRIGNTLFDVSKGSKSSFSEDIVKVDVENKTCCMLGQIQKKLVVIPEIE